MCIANLIQLNRIAYTSIYIYIYTCKEFNQTLLTQIILPKF